MHVVLPCAAQNPAMHVQAVSALEETGEVIFAGQSVHVAVPDTDLYFPAGHAVHVLVDAPETNPV